MHITGWTMQMPGADRIEIEAVMAAYITKADR
jgi:hypothetical protein